MGVGGGPAGVRNSFTQKWPDDIIIFVFQNFYFSKIKLRLDFSINNSAPLQTIVQFVKSYAAVIINFFTFKLNKEMKITYRQCLRVRAVTIWRLRSPICPIGRQLTRRSCRLPPWRTPIGRRPSRGERCQPQTYRGA